MTSGESTRDRTTRGGSPWQIVAIHGIPLILLGLCTAVAGRDDLDMVGHAGTLSAGRELLAARRPDVAVIGLELPDGRGLDLLAELRGGDVVKTVVLGYELTDAGRREAAGHGADAVVDLATGTGALMTVIVETARGDVVIPLPPRQRQIVKLVAQGRTNDEIGAALGISHKTVETHLSRLYQHFGLVSRTEVPLLAQRSGWLDRTADDLG